MSNVLVSPRRIVSFNDADNTVLYTIVDYEGNVKCYRQSKEDYTRQLNLAQYKHLAIG